MHITCQSVSQSDVNLICKDVHNMDFLHFSAFALFRWKQIAYDVVAIGGTV